MNEIYYTFTLIDAFFSFAGFQCPTVTQTKNPAVHEIHETCPSVTFYFMKKKKTKHDGITSSLL